MTAVGNISPAAANPEVFRAIDPRGASYLLRLVAVCALAASVVAVDPLAYLCVAIPILLPSLLWLKSGAFGIPVLPVISLLFFVYYAVPLLQGDALKYYRPEEIVWAAISVGLFLCAASAASWPFLGPVRKKAGPAATGRVASYARSFSTKSFSKNLSSAREMHRLIFIGLGSGLLYYVAVVTGAASLLGTYIGAVRAVTLTLTSVSCYLMGYARGRGTLTGRQWTAALTAFLAVTGLAMSNLLLVGGAINIGAIALGYVLAARRIPWLAVASAFLIMSILNAGKYSMRAMYWSPDSQVVQSSSVLQMPAMMADWFAAGIGAIGSPGAGGSQLLERTSLLHMVLAVQEATPRYIPYLDGKTYGFLPKMLIPRFLEEDKLESQAGLNYLSVRYGRERAEDVGKTTIGWGLVSEAYANFGNAGVLMMGALFGALCGMLMRLSASATPLSLAMLITIASTLTLCNMEGDFSYLMVSLAQTIGAILLFAALPRFAKRPVTAYAPPNLAERPRSAGARPNAQP